MVREVDDFDRCKWMLAGGMYVERRTGWRTPENADVTEPLRDGLRVGDDAKPAL